MGVDVVFDVGRLLRFKFVLLIFELIFKFDVFFEVFLLWLILRSVW